MIRSKLVILTICLFALVAVGRSVRAEGVLEKLTGNWTVDFAKSVELADIDQADKDKLKAAGDNGLKIKLQVKADGTSQVTIAIPGQTDQNVGAEFKVLAEDDKGAFIHSLTGGGQKKERVQVTYLPSGDQKIWFADIGYPLVFVKAAE